MHAHYKQLACQSLSINLVGSLWLPDGWFYLSELQAIKEHVFVNDKRNCN